jgi:hypothetical protein
MTLKPEIKTLWLEALRSGRYKQGFYRLKSGGDNFCCLGVLCDLYIQETGQGRWDTHPETGPEAFRFFPNSIFPNSSIGSVDSSIGTPPPQVSSWAGEHLDSWVVGEHTLQFYNDSEHLTFHQIADLIEKHL